MPDPVKIKTAVFDPEWQWGTIKFDGNELIGLTLMHPTHGPITSILPKAIALQMGSALVQLASAGETRQ